MQYWCRATQWNHPSANYIYNIAKCRKFNHDLSELQIRNLPDIVPSNRGSNSSINSRALWFHFSQFTTDIYHFPIDFAVVWKKSLQIKDKPSLKSDIKSLLLYLIGYSVCHKKIFTNLGSKKKKHVMYIMK